MSDDFDVIIIGTGAGGGTLAPSGKRILLLERGDFLTRETENWDPGPVFVDGRYISSDTSYDGDGTPFQPQVHCFVGGATKLYGAALYRLRLADFGALQHADGISPAWPLSYQDFEPWYTEAEWLFTCTASMALTPPRVRGHASTRGRRSRMSHGSSKSPTLSRRAATTRSRLRAGSCWTRQTGPEATA